MHPLDLATIGTGLAMIVVGALVPAVTSALIPAGIGLVMWGLKKPSDLTSRAKDPDDS